MPSTDSLFSTVFFEADNMHPPTPHPTPQKKRPCKKGKKKKPEQRSRRLGERRGSSSAGPFTGGEHPPDHQVRPHSFRFPVRNRGTPNLNLHFPIRNRYMRIIPINFDFPLQTVDAPLPPMPQVESATASEAPPPQDAWLVELGSRLPQWESLRDSSKVQSTDAPVFSHPRVCSAVW
jgi:hypothetical protein